SLLFVFVVCLSNITFAQNAGQGNVEALENINQSLERIESAITTLTSQNEENVYNQKKEKAENEVVLKDIKLQIKDIVEAQEKISKDVYSQKIEIENLKNIVAMLQEKLAFVEKKSNSEPKIEDKATKNPTDLLVVDNKEPKEIKEEKISDDESFKLAMENFNKKYFTESAINFASNLKNFPEGNNFHKNLLYLGLSMQKLENKNGACTAFAKIINSNEKIENEIRDVAVREFETLNCNTEKAEEKK
ncbi:MAG: hypothetical protein IJ638_02650, partial [Alphaproteobacteria bacterium]|nr:hypothetical protein [Alphaproteobacteria bacterium]